MRKHPGQSDYGSNFAVCIGIVKNNADPAQHGRLQIYIPSIDSNDYSVEDLPWATYVTPFGGSTVNYKAGREQSTVSGVSTYGFWAIPKINAQVLCGFLEGDPAMRYWMGCIYQPELNRTLPSSIDPLKTEIDESGMYPQQPISHLQKNLGKAGLGVGTPHYKTRGGYERSVSHPSNKNKVKPTDNGYFTKPNDGSKADSQTLCLTSPGRHYLVMSDVDEYCRIRLKTCEGSQIIFDDTNERIYVSTAQGKNWIELDEGNGKIYIYSDSKVSIRAKNDINLYSDENINIVAKHRVNIKSEDKSINLFAKHDIRLNSTHADILMTASRDIHIKTLNGPKAGPEPVVQFCEATGKNWVYRWAEKGGASSSKIFLDAQEHIHVKSSLESVRITGKKKVELKSLDEDIRIQSTKKIQLKSDIAIHGAAPDIKLKAKVYASFYFSPLPVVTESGDPETAQPAILADSGQAVTPDTITDQMIKPDHESWTRDEDAGKCKTPRNKKYQG